MYFYLLFMLPFMLLALWASMRVKGTFARYSQVPVRSGLTGAQAARLILEASGVRGVEIREVPGMLSDHYNPVDRTVNLSGEVLRGRSVAAVGVAAHEVGHALQHAKAYAPMQARAALVPVMNLSSSLAFPMILAGMFLHIPALTLVAIGFFGLAVLFHMVTLPVEFDASRRAVAILAGSGVVAADELPAVKKTLNAAGFTYVAATLVAAAELLYWLLRSGLLGGSRE